MSPDLEGVRVSEVRVPVEVDRCSGRSFQGRGMLGGDRVGVVHLAGLTEEPLEFRQLDCMYRPLAYGFVRCPVVGAQHSPHPRHIGSGRLGGEVRRLRQRAAISPEPMTC
jgi:hypothetical protein